MTQVPDDVDPLVLAERASETLFHTAGGSKLHIRACPYFQPGSAPVPTTPTDAESRELCSSCAAELAGRGRTPYTSLEVAMQALPVPVAARATVRELVGEIQPERIWIPYSNPYVALGRTGHKTVHIGKTAVWLTDDPIPLPGYTGRRSRSTTSSGRPEQPTCPSCKFELLTSGACGYC